jgi:hypothetical protein
MLEGQREDDALTSMLGMQKGFPIRLGTSQKGNGAGGEAAGRSGRVSHAQKAV